MKYHIQMDIQSSTNGSIQKRKTALGKKIHKNLLLKPGRDYAILLGMRLHLRIECIFCSFIGV